MNLHNYRPKPRYLVIGSFGPFGPASESGEIGLGCKALGSRI